MKHLPRFVIALLIGIVTGGLASWHLSVERAAAGDFSWPLQGARVLVNGGDPYQDNIQPLPYDPTMPLLYPLPAVLVAVPLAGLTNSAAVFVFFGASCGLLAWALLRDGAWRLLIFVSMPFCISLTVSQWGPLLCAALVLPSFGWAAACKPNLGLAVLVARPSRTRVFALAIVGVLSLAVLPSWPWSWYNNVAIDRYHIAPLWVFPGVVLLAALLRWRDWRARLIVALAAVPHLGYDLILLQLVARTAREQLILVAGSWITLIGVALVGGGARWWLIGCYLPALILVLRHNDASQPRKDVTALLELRNKLRRLHWLTDMADVKHGPSVQKVHE